MLCDKQMQQSSATIQLGSILPLSNIRAVYGVLQPDLLLIPSLWHPGSEKPEHPVFQPRDRGEVFWNMTLLSIE